MFLVTGGAGYIGSHVVLELKRRGKEVVVLDIVEVTRKVTGHSIPIEFVNRRIGDPPVLISSSQKAKEILKWKPIFENIEDIISSAWYWHSRN